MDKIFDIVFLNETFEFLSNLEKKHYGKIIFNIRKAQTKHDPELFKKLKDEIWEFRTLYQDCITDYYHFGTRQILEIHLLFRRME